MYAGMAILPKHPVAPKLFIDINHFPLLRIYGQRLDSIFINYFIIYFHAYAADGTNGSHLHIRLYAYPLQITGRVIIENFHHRNEKFVYRLLRKPPPGLLRKPPLGLHKDFYIIYNGIASHVNL